MAMVSVRVPSTTGNLGSGFDCIGMALSLHNNISLSDDADGLIVEVEGEGEDLVPCDERNVCVKAALEVFGQIGKKPGGLKFTLDHKIPVSRGLGSSGVAIVGGAFAANELAGRPLDTEALLRICSDIEGHPDNVVPSLLGGISISGEREGRIIYRTFDVPRNLMAIVAVPNFTLDTSVARQALPSSVTMQDAVFNMCSVGILISGFLNQDYDALYEGMNDRLHQPYRQSLIPGFQNVMTAARLAGAHGTALSGAGPTIIALASHNQNKIADAMKQAFANHDITSRTMILPIDNDGTQLTS